MRKYTTFSRKLRQNVPFRPSKAWLSYISLSEVLSPHTPKFTLFKCAEYIWGSSRYG